MSPVESQQILDLGSKHKFLLGGHACAAVIVPRGFKFHYDLEVDGVSIVTGQSTDIDEVQKREFAGARWGICIFFILLGLGAVWINWNWAHTDGFYNEEIALITPMPIVVAVYFMLFPKDYVDQFNGRFSYRLVLVLVIVIIIALGLLNSYALGNGLY